MKRLIVILVFLFGISVVLLFAQKNLAAGHCAPPPPEIKSTPALPPLLMNGIGNSVLKITTTSPEAQAHFNQGLSLFHCFWWNEALASFRETARLDSACTMAHWGIYQTLANPWYFNDGEIAKERAAALQKAKALSGNASERERHYILAADRRESLGGEAYIQEMEKLIIQYPDEVEAKLVLALFLFQDNFSHGYDANGRPTPNRQKCQSLLRELLKTHPDHAAVHHYWIHAMEGSREPEAALESAKKVGILAPASGHIVHMAGHIYFKGSWLRRTAAVSSAGFGKFGSSLSSDARMETGARRV